MNAEEYIIPIIILFSLVNCAAFIRLQIFSSLPWKTFKRVLIITNIVLTLVVAIYIAVER